MISPELLRRFRLFAGLPPEVFADIAQFCEETVLETDTYLFEQKAPADELYLILEGAADLLMDMDENGQERTEIETVVVGEVIGWSSIVEPHVYQLSAVAASHLKVIVVNATKLREYLSDKPEWGYLLMMHLAQVIGERLGNMRTRFVSMV